METVTERPIVMEMVLNIGAAAPQTMGLLLRVRQQVALITKIALTAGIVMERLIMMETVLSTGAAAPQTTVRLPRTLP